MSIRHRPRASVSDALIGAEGQKVSASLRAGAIPRYLGPLPIRLGIAHVFWEGREYEVFHEHLHQYAELVESA